MNTTTPVNRSIPSRELDAEVARALGWTDVSYGPVYWMKQSDWRGFPPHETMMIAAIPAYTTAPAWDSACWGEMLAWLMSHTPGFDIQARRDGFFIDGPECFRVTVLGKTLGHALALAVLAVADWARKETSNEQSR